MKAIILVGGFGTRLRPLTLQTPKTLLPIHNRPFISYQIDILKDAGVKDITFAAGHLYQKLKTTIPRLGYNGIRFRFARERTPLGTGGAIRFAYDSLKIKKSDQSEPVIVFNGDVLMDLDVNRMISFHKKSKSDCTIALTKVPDGTRFGVVKTASKRRVRKFLEKNPRNKGVQWINAGAYIFNPKLIREIPARKPVSIEKHSFPAYLKRNRRLFGYRFSGYWNDIGTPATYLEAHIDLAQKKNRWTRRGNLRKKGILTGRGTKIAKNAVLERMVFGGQNVKIGQNSRLSYCVLMDHVKIGKGVTITGAIVGSYCQIGDFSHINPGVVLGNKSKLSPYTKI